VLRRPVEPAGVKQTYRHRSNDAIDPKATLATHPPAAVIVTYGAAALTFKRATASIPIVLAVANDPVGIGLVASLSRPGGNVTGLSLQATDAVGKRLELLREVVPGLRRLAILFDAAIPRQRWKWAMFRLGREASASRSWPMGSGAQRILRPCSML
jgi:ABC-type uncharacterized transport system substrate-binding protein